jgi:hypothetical protein
VIASRLGPAKEERVRVSSEPAHVRVATVEETPADDVAEAPPVAAKMTIG